MTIVSKSMEISLRREKPERTGRKAMWGLNLHMREAAKLIAEDPDTGEIKVDDEPIYVVAPSKLARNGKKNSRG